MSITPSPLDELHRERQARLRGAVASRLSLLLASMLDLSEEQLHAYSTGALPVTVAGQRSAATLAAGYALALARQQKRAPAIDAALARSGVMVTGDSPNVVAPVLRARALVAEGAELPEAIDAAGRYAKALSSSDLQAALRVGLGEGADASGRLRHGFVMVLSPSGCAWCRLVSGTTKGKLKLYRGPDTVPWHLNCHCSAAPAYRED